MGSGARDRDVAIAVPGDPGPASSRTKARRARSLNPPGAARRDRDQREAGPQGLKTPKWSAVRRGRCIAGQPARKSTRLDTKRRYGAPLPCWEQDTLSAFGGSDNEKERTEASGGIPPAREAKHAQAKWKPVRRPGMRQTKRGSMTAISTRPEGR